MITIIQRYIANTLLITTFFVVVIVIGLAFFVGLLGELKDIGVGDYNFTQAVIHTFLRLPYVIYQFFPMLVLVGGMMGLGTLATNRELIVIRTSGVSILKIMGAVIMASVVLIVLATILGELIAPQANFLADKRKDSAENFGQAVATASGVWVHEGNNFLHIEKVLGVEHLEGVTRYEFNAQHQLISAYYAKFLDYQQGRWLLRDVVKTSFLQDKTVSEKMAALTWNISLKPNLLNVGLIEPQEMSLPVLYKYSRHLVENKSQATRFQFELWKRILQPLMTLVMILLAIPFVFGSPRSVTMGWRILLGVIVGFVFYIMNALLGQFSVVFQISPFVSALLPTLVFAVLGGGLLLRVR